MNKRYLRLLDFNKYLLFIVVIVISIGTFAPLFRIFNSPFIIGPHFYNELVMPISLSIVIFMGINPYLKQGRKSWHRSIYFFMGLVVALLVSGLVYILLYLFRFPNNPSLELLKFHFFETACFFVAYFLLASLLKLSILRIMHPLRWCILRIMHPLRWCILRMQRLRCYIRNYRRCFNYKSIRKYLNNYINRCQEQIKSMPDYVTNFRNKKNNHSCNSENAYKSRNCPRRIGPMIMSHLGITVSMIGIAVANVYETEAILIMFPGEQVSLYNVLFTFRGTTNVELLNYHNSFGNFVLRVLNDSSAKELGNDLLVAATEVKPISVFSEKRFYVLQNMFTTKIGVVSNLFSDIAVSVNDGNYKAGYLVRVFYKPGLPLIWIGAILLLVGGCLLFRKNKAKNGF